MAVAQTTIWFVYVDILHLIAYNISKGGAFMGQATFSVRMDENLKNDFDSLCADFGMSMTTAVFLLKSRQAVPEDPDCPEWRRFRLSVRRRRRTAYRTCLLMR